MSTWELWEKRALDGETSNAKARGQQDKATEDMFGSTYSTRLLLEDTFEDWYCVPEKLVCSQLYRKSKTCRARLSGEATRTPTGKCKPATLHELREER